MSGCHRFLGERRSEHIYGKWEGIRGRGVVAEARSYKARGGCVFRNKGWVEKGRDVIFFERRYILRSSTWKKDSGLLMLRSYAHP